MRIILNAPFERWHHLGLTQTLACRTRSRTRLNAHDESHWLGWLVATRSWREITRSAAAGGCRPRGERSDREQQLRSRSSSAPLVVSTARTLSGPDGDLRAVLPPLRRCAKLELSSALRLQGRQQRRGGRTGSQAVRVRMGESTSQGARRTRAGPARPFTLTHRRHHPAHPSQASERLTDAPRAFPLVV